VHQLVTVSVDDLKAALRRRGPDSLGSKKIILQYNKNLSSVDDRELVSVVTDDAEIENDQSFLQNCSNGKAGNYNQLGYSVGELQFIGATLQLRGLNPIIQPFVDSYGNVLIYNGKISDLYTIFFLSISVMYVLYRNSFNLVSNLVL
jgi:hypothetical protein